VVEGQSIISKIYSSLNNLPQSETHDKSASLASKTRYISLNSINVVSRSNRAVTLSQSPMCRKTATSRRALLARTSLSNTLVTFLMLRGEVRVSKGSLCVKDSILTLRCIPRGGPLLRQHIRMLQFPILGEMSISSLHEREYPDIERNDTPWLLVCGG
jgi:hypothetical protein